MKICITIIAVIMIVACTSNTKESDQQSKNYSFFVGTYTDTLSEGIYRYQLGSDGTLKRIGLAGKTENPSFLAKSADNKFLLAVNEVNRDSVGSVVSFSISGDSLTFISKSSSGGAHPCFVAVNKSGYVLAANYTGGNVGLLQLNSKGELSSLLDLQQHTGHGPTDRQLTPHAHSAWFDPINGQVISVDLGTDQLWLSHIDTINQKFVPSNPYQLNMEPGAGPRHLAFHPNGKWIYVVDELGGTVTQVLKTGENTYSAWASFSTLPEGYKDPNTCADIHISSDGKFVYASNRGHNSIAIFEVNQSDGTLKLLGHESVHGNWPRNFSLSPDDEYLVVANQYSNNIVSFKRDKNTGLLTFVSEIEAPVPVCILF